MLEENRVKILAMFLAVCALAGIMICQTKVEEPELQTIKIGFLSPTKQGIGSYKFLGNIAIDEVNRYCENQSLPYRFEPVYNYTTKGAGYAIKITDWYHSQNISLLIGYDWGSFMDACDYQSRNYGMVMISPYCPSAVHRKVYDHIFRLHPVELQQTKVIAETMVALGFNETIVFRETSRGYSDYLAEEFELHYGALGGVIKGVSKYPSSNSLASMNMSLARLNDVVNGSDIAILYIGTSLDTNIAQSLRYYPHLVNLTWFGGGDVHFNHTEYLSETPDLVDIQLIHPSLNYMAPPGNEKANELNSLYLREFNRSMMTYTGNTYDAVWLAALTMLETGTYHNETFISTLPEVAKEYSGITGNCSIDQYGDRVWGDYTIYKFVERDDNVYIKTIGSYEWEKGKVEWKP